VSGSPSSSSTERHAQLMALAGKLRPELHRYCARLTGSVIDGEDVVQDTFARAFAGLHEVQEAPPLRAWLFRIAHNRALDCCAARRSAQPSPSRRPVRSSIRRAQILWRC
jgi:DNA-directed RNA polymerase specialized sigma24 family protein